MPEQDPSDEDEKIVPLVRKGGSCPICSAPSLLKYRPFCSARCAEIDLGRWMKGNYAIPSDEPVTSEDLVPDGDD